MGLFDGIKTFFTNISSGEMYVMHIYVRCRRCGELIDLRMDRRFDLLPEYGQNLIVGYSANKDILGNKCYNLIRVHIDYNAEFRQRSFQVEGGTLLTRKEYEAAGGGKPQAGSK
jgi:hypothetical protein